MVTSYSLSYDASSELNLYPTFKAKGALPEEDGSVMVRFDEIINYNIECQVRIV